MDRAENMVPAREKIKIYENSVPVINAWPRILMHERSKKERNERMSRASIRGRFAIPRRIKGAGFGMRYSTVERKRQNAPRSAILSPSFFLLKGFGVKMNLGGGIAFDVNKYVIGKAGYPGTGAMDTAGGNAGLVSTGR
jgi:hypothetical protein